MNLTLQDVTVAYTGPAQKNLLALGPLTMAFDSGAFTAILGPSGCGKSTLLRVLAGLQTVSSGVAYLAGRRITASPQEVGVMFQSPNLMAWRTVQDNIALPLELRGIPKQERYQAVLDLLPLLGLSDFVHAYPSELSGGMAQRAALGRALIQRPHVLLLDEPFGALDALTREQVALDLLHLWSQFHQTVVMVTHDIQEAVLLADRVIILSSRPGRVVADLPVTLARPRELDMIYTPEFIALARAVRQALEL